MSIKDEVKKMKAQAPLMAASTIKTRNEALKYVVKSLQENKNEIFLANEKDLEEAKENEVLPAIIKRLKFDEEKLSDVVEGIRMLIELEDPVGKITLARELDDGLKLYRQSCPIGVIGVIFEARPDALVQISTLCIKSGNCAILKGGKETKHTNKALFELIKGAALEAGLPENCLLQAQAHSEIDELLSCHDCVDLLIPRGSNAFVSYIMNNTKIPVMGHADGICHIYVDKDADLDKAIPIIMDAKTQYTAACNAVETILVHKDIAKEFLPMLLEAAKNNSVELCGTREVSDIISVETVKVDDFKEYLDLKASVGTVSGLKEAVDHINTHGSHHTDCIITENGDTAAEFMNLVDSAGVYQNCSTRFADGFRYGFGAEVGISTSKIHARGPVGLEGLVIYKYKLFGNGHIVGDYASGKKNFKHREI